MKPHIVLILTDDQRHDTIRALGYPRMITPNMDKLVRRGTTFRRAFIPGGTCGAICMPSRAMLHTGRNLFHLQGSGEQIPAEHALLGETLQTAGYQTFGIGKWHNGPSAYQRSFSDGAEIFFGGMADHWNVPAYDYDPSGCYDATCPIIENPMDGNAVRYRKCGHIHAGRHSTDTLTEAALQFLKGAPTDSPYFLYLSFLAPHDPRSMPDKYRQLYDPAEMELPENFQEAHAFDNGELHVRDEMLAAHPRDPQEIRRHLAEYYAMITHLDDRIGEVMQAVKARGEEDRTLFVLCGDNGLALGQHGLMGKQSLYEHSVRVPLIFAGPGIPEGKVTDEFACLLDIFPTLCRLAEVEIPDSVQGHALDQVIRDGAPSARQSLYLAYEKLHRAIRTDQHKLIEYVVGGDPVMTQLFDLANDPLEMRNLAADPGHATLLVELREKLFQMRDESGDALSPWGKSFWQGYQKTQP